MRLSLVPMQLDVPFAGRFAPFVLGVCAAAVAALLVTFHWLAFVLAALVVIVLSSIENESFLLLMIFLLPLHSVPNENLPELMSTGRVLLVAGFFIGRLWRGQVNLKRLTQPFLSRAVLLFAAVAFLSVFFGTAGWTHDSALALMRLVSYLGFYFFVVAWIDSRHRMQRVGLTLLTSSILVATFAVYQEIAGNYSSLWLYLRPAGQEFGPWDNRATSFFGFPNFLANYLNFTIPFALACYVLIEATRWKKLAAWSVGLGAVALAFSQSRGGLVALGFVLVVAIFYFVKRWWIRLPMLLGLGLLVSLSYFLGTVLNPGHLAEIEQTTGVSRLLLWDTAWNLFTQSPLFGVGWGNFEQLYGYYIHASWIPPGGLWVHNLYLQLLSETGLVGFGGFFFVVFIALREARRQLRVPNPFYRAVSFGVLGAILTMLVHGFVDTVIGAQIAAMYWMLLALLAANGLLCSAHVEDSGILEYHP